MNFTCLSSTGPFSIAMLVLWCVYILDDTCLLKFDDEVVCLVINSVDVCVCVCVCVLSLLLQKLVGDLLRVGWLRMARTGGKTP